MPPRSWASWTMVCLKASPSVPTRFLTGTRTSVKNNSQKCSLPTMSRTVRTSMPGRSIATISSAHTHMRRAGAVGATDEVAVVGVGCAAGPHFLPVDDIVGAVAHRRGLQRGQVGSGVGLAHPDAPGGLARQDARQELGPLGVGAVGVDRGTHLPVGEPARGDRGTRADHLLGHDDPLDARPAAAADLGRPGHPDPALAGQNLGELLGVPVDPRVVPFPVVGHAPLERRHGRGPAALSHSGRNAKFRLTAAGGIQLAAGRRSRHGGATRSSGSWQPAEPLVRRQRSEQHQQNAAG